MTDSPGTGSGSYNRRSLWRVVLIAGLQTGGLLAVYYIMPVTTRDPSFAIRFGGSVALVALVGVWQVRRVIAADSRLHRSLAALGFAIPFLVVVYSGLYLTLSGDNPDAFSEVLGKTSALYFTVTTLATVGFGDISPSSDLARIVAMTQMIANVTLIGFSVRIVSSMATYRFQRHPSRKLAAGQVDHNREPLQ